MTATNIATGNALARKIWDEQLHRDAAKSAWFSKFEGEGSESIVQVKNALTKEKGDKITFGIRMRLTGSGVGEGSTLEGNEEALTTYDASVTLSEINHAVIDAGVMARQRGAFNISTEAKAALQDWKSEKMDALKFAALASTPTRNFYVNSSSAVATTGTYATAKAALDATKSRITPKLMDYAKAWALTGGNRAQTPLRPIKIKGKTYFVLVMHPDVAYDLRQDSTWFAAMRDALPRAEDHPIFSGALGMWNGIVLHEHESVPIFTDGGGASVPGSNVYLLGAQALCWANGVRVPTVEKKFDYDRQHGHAVGMVYGVTKPVFNSKDYGSVCLAVSREKISDAA